MPNFPRLFLLVALATLAFAACAHHPKSSVRTYSGDSPTIHYTGREAAGGPLGGR